MPEILLTSDYTDEQTRITYPAGTTLIMHPDSPAYKSLLQNGSAEKLIPLPSDVPGYAHLVKAGVTTLQALFGITDFTGIKGIGEKTQTEIDNYIQQLTTQV